jgi:ribokinase
MTTKARAIVVVGSYMRDTVFRTARLPRAGETIAASGVAVSHGGKGSNQAIQAARCGAPVSLIAAVGDDAAADAARELWRAEAIDHRGVATRPGERTGMAFIAVDDRGDNQIVIAAGANAGLAAADVERSEADIAAAGAVLAQLETPVATTLRAFELARQAGALTVLNAAPLAAPEALGPLLALTDLLVCNLGEAQALLGDDARDPLQLARRLAERAQGRALVTLGPRGACLHPGGAGEPLRQPAVAARRVVDTTGAGDAFLGAFLCRWLETRDWAEALRFGAAAGSIACETAGAVPSFGSRPEIQQRLGA